MSDTVNMASFKRLATDAASVSVSCSCVAVHPEASWKCGLLAFSCGYGQFQFSIMEKYDMIFGNQFLDGSNSQKP